MTHSPEQIPGWDNPPAFPSVCLGDPDHPASKPGMSLQDWFAGQALAGLLASNHRPPAVNPASYFAARAYAYADAMLAARKKGGDQ